MVLSLVEFTPETAILTHRRSILGYEASGDKLVRVMGLSNNAVTLPGDRTEVAVTELPAAVVAKERVNS